MKWEIDTKITCERCNKGTIITTKEWTGEETAGITYEEACEIARYNGEQDPKYSCQDRCSYCDYESSTYESY